MQLNSLKASNFRKLSAQEAAQLSVGKCPLIRVEGFKLMQGGILEGLTLPFSVVTQFPMRWQEGTCGKDVVTGHRYTLVGPFTYTLV